MKDSKVEESISGYFWYSRKQRQAILYHANFCQLDDGRIVEYSEWTTESKYTSLWDDVEYLGHGKYHHYEAR